MIARRTFVLSSSPRPTIFLEWFVIAATVIAIRRREWRLVLQVAALMLTDWGIDTLGMARGLKQEYFLLTDPLVIIAAALLVAKLTDLQRHRWTYPLGADADRRAHPGEPGRAGEAYLPDRRTGGDLRACMAMLKRLQAQLRACKPQ